MVRPDVVPQGTMGLETAPVMTLLPPWPFPPATARHAAVPDPRVPVDDVRRSPPGRVRGSAGVVVDRFDAAAAAAHREAWTDLAGRALEANVFLDPDFALPAAQHLEAGRHVSFLFAWAHPDRAPEDLVAVCAVTDRRRPFRGLAPVWLHDLSTVGVPLLDGARATPALHALLTWAERGLAGCHGLLVRSMPADGPTARTLATVALEAGLAVAVLDDWERAVLRPGSGRAGLAALSAKGAKELRRQRRRLEDAGTLAFASAREGDALRDGVERFLALEATGWKGRAGTAFLARPERTAFVRAAMRLLARRNLCRVDALTLDGDPIAMAVLLTAGRTASLWKIAYREDLSRLSPGVQLVLDITGAQRTDAGLDLTDSCAIPDHPMIDRLWRDRMRFVDVAVALRPAPGAGFAAAVAADRAARRLRAGAKRLLQAWRSRRAGRSGGGA